MSVMVKIPQLHCERCEHDWTPRADKGVIKIITGKDGIKYAIIEVSICPACKTPYFNKPRAIKRSLP